MGSDLDCRSCQLRLPEISIHAPRVGSDSRQMHRTQHCLDFNPRSPCGERHCDQESRKSRAPFQSTLPVWGATMYRCFLPGVAGISIHAPRVGSDLRGLLPRCARRISIHAPRVGSDPSQTPSTMAQTNFNPRSPCGERPCRFQASLCQRNFNPRSPCGERPDEYEILTDMPLFQSTLPVWGATRRIVVASSID